MTAGPLGRIALCFFEWSNEDQQIVVVDWVQIAGASEARDVAQRIRQAQGPLPLVPLSVEPLTTAMKFQQVLTAVGLKSNPLIVSLPKPTAKTNVSSPERPVMMSLPAPPSSLSMPLPPLRLSAPSPPANTSSPEPPAMTLLPSLPVTVLASPLPEPLMLSLTRRGLSAPYRFLNRHSPSPRRRGRRRHRCRYPSRRSYCRRRRLHRAGCQK